jgi:hypothetical protein
MRQRSRDRLEFCETVGVWLLIVLARILEDGKRSARRAR